MDSTLNSKRSLSDSYSLEEDKHKIWSPVPVKLYKAQDTNNVVQAFIANNDSPFSSKSKKPSVQSFTSTNSAFRSIFSDSNRLNMLSLSTSNSTISNGEKLSVRTTKSDKSSDVKTSGLQRVMQNVSLNIDESLFGKQARIVETPKFRINVNSFNELSSLQLSQNPSSDYIIKSKDSFTESFLANGYVNFLAALCSRNNTNCESPQEEKETPSHTHSNKCSHGVNNESNKLSAFLKPNLSKKKTRHCNCKNSKCLKLYCECLAHGEYCDDSCNCCDCHNNVQKEEVRAYAISLIMEKKPEILEGENLKKQNRSKIVRGKGCNCKKSACLKKYCECYNSGAGCGPHCKCEGCKNPHPKPDDAESPTSNVELESQIPANIMADLGLGLKNEAYSDKGNVLNMGLDLLKPQRNKSLPAFGRELSSNSVNSLTSLPFFGFGSGL